MKVINENRFKEYFNCLVVDDRKYLEVPQLLCAECYQVIFVSFKRDPNRLEIEDCYCTK